MPIYDYVFWVLGLILMIFSGYIARFLSSVNFSDGFTEIKRLFQPRQEDQEEPILIQAQVIGEPASPISETRPKAHISAKKNASIKWLDDLVYFVAMFLGMTVKEVWDYFNENSRIGVNPSRLAIAVMLTPITYILVHSKFIKGKLSFLGFCLAFQNGFFWQTFIHNAQGGK